MRLALAFSFLVHMALALGLALLSWQAVPPQVIVPPPLDVELVGEPPPGTSPVRSQSQEEATPEPAQAAAAGAPEPDAAPADLGPPPAPAPRAPEPATKGQKPPPPAKTPPTDSRKLPERAKTPPEAAKPAPAPPALDLESFRNLANKEPANGPAAPTKPPRAPNSQQGLVAGKGEKLAASEEDALRARLAKCWRAPADLANPQRLIVAVRIQLARDGSLIGSPRVEEPAYIAPGDRALVTAAENALRAVRQCAPFPLPPEKYDTWRDILFNFDPREMAQ